MDRGGVIQSAAFDRNHGREAKDCETGGIAVPGGRTGERGKHVIADVVVEHRIDHIIDGVGRDRYLPYRIKDGRRGHRRSSVMHDAMVVRREYEYELVKQDLRIAAAVNVHGPCIEAAKELCVLS